MRATHLAPLAHLPGRASVRLWLCVGREHYFLMRPGERRSGVVRTLVGARALASRWLPLAADRNLACNGRRAEPSRVDDLGLLLFVLRCAYKQVALCPARWLANDDDDDDADADAYYADADDDGGDEPPVAVSQRKRAAH